jgi:hypothetical protein
MTSGCGRYHRQDEERVCVDAQASVRNSDTAEMRELPMMSALASRILHSAFTLLRG